MRKSARRFYSSIRGFTLIELMVVIAIIAILATVGLTIYSAAEKAARDGKRISDIQEIQKGLEQFYAVNQSYPDAKASSPYIDNTTSFYGYFENNTPPTDPLNTSSSHYVYAQCNSNKDYVLCATTETSGKGNASAYDTSSCSFTSGSGSDYCVTQLSN